MLDEGTYLASVSTFYRVLRARGEVRERRRQAVHPAAVKPELLAEAPNRVWSWDITKLHGPAKWTYYYLYVIIDIFSRYVPGWMVATCESAALAGRLIAGTGDKQQIVSGQLTVHADRGSSMTSKPAAFLLAGLGITQSHSRPHVTNDNPFSESQFKTLKYRPYFPGRFGSIEHARAHCQGFFPWYNDRHWHSGLGLHTPVGIHYGRAHTVQAARAGDVEFWVERIHAGRSKAVLVEAGATALRTQPPAEACEFTWDDTLLSTAYFDRQPDGSFSQPLGGEDDGPTGCSRRGPSATSPRRSMAHPHWP